MQKTLFFLFSFLLITSVVSFEAYADLTIGSTLLPDNSFIIPNDEIVLQNNEIFNMTGFVSNAASRSYRLNQPTRALASSAVFSRVTRGRHGTSSWPIPQPRC